MPINRLERAPATTVTTVPGTAVTAPTFAFEGTYCVFYTRDAPAASAAAPNAFNTVVRVEKTTAANTFAVGAAVHLDVATQKALTTGGTGKMGVAAKASANGDPYVIVALNE